MDLRAVHAELAGQAAELRDLVKRRPRPVLVAGEQVHQVDVPRVESPEVIVVLELAVVVAQVPVAAGRDAVDQRPVMQHRQVETAAVPGDELRGVLLDAVEKALHDVALDVLRRSQRPHAYAVVAAQRARDGHDTLQVMGQEIAAGGLAAALRGEVNDSRFAHLGAERPNPPQAIDVGDRLDVEYQDGRHGAAFRSGRRRWRGSGRRDRRRRARSPRRAPPTTRAAPPPARRPRRFPRRFPPRAQGAACTPRFPPA